MYKQRPLTAIDFYKADHRPQYPKGTQLVYSNFTPRSDRLFKWEDKCGKVVFFGLQGIIKAFLQDFWTKEFFRMPKRGVIEYYKKRMDTSLGENAITMEHVEALHDLGYLPIRIRALREGTLVPIGVPMFTIINTHPDYFWLTNYLESILSNLIWGPCTSATIAYEYRRLLDKFAEKTGGSKDFVDFQAHDFSFRGLMGPDAAASVGAGHLTSFKGTDTVMAIDFMEDYYNIDATKEMIGGSVPATEHSVMCAGGHEDEYGTLKRLICDLYPSGIISIVSDTWDFWKVLTYYANILKGDIMRRDGKVVFRPDSGDPVDIICGTVVTPDSRYSLTPEEKGAVQCLWDIFGGTVNEKGFKQLDPHVGLIYGDSITLDRAKKILERLEKMGFASDNIVFGVGSFTYQYNTRDTFGFAMKATWCMINNEGAAMFKDPVTDSGTKKSAKGLLRVNSDLTLEQEVSIDQEAGGLLLPVFQDGELISEQTLTEIRARIKEG